MFAKWGNVIEQIAEDSARPKILNCQNSHGETLHKQNLPLEYDGYPTLYPSRGRAHKYIYEYARSIGVEFRLDTRVSEYFENEDEAGVFAGTEKFTADLVIAADGVHSKAKSLIANKVEKVRSSGFAAYRCWFSYDALKAKNDPLLDEIINAKEDLYYAWIGPDVHALVMTNIKMQYVACFCTHKVRMHSVPNG